ncbi:MAG: hypothetical protein P1U58_09520 [Verrucomicrobiales bacterium]|nr:hypothetical protein [Verrucomicrobiales bacterium]
MGKSQYIGFVSVGLLSLFVRMHSAEVEVGEVEWGRNLDFSLKASAESGRPVLVLFQEVPG